MIGVCTVAWITTKRHGKMNSLYQLPIKTTDMWIDQIVSFVPNLPPVGK